MDGRPYFITVEEARALTFQTLPPLTVEQVPIEASSHRVLARDLASKVNDPPFDNSAMDGFACRYDSNATYPQTLDIIGVQAASGSNETVEAGAGQAVRI